MKNQVKFEANLNEEILRKMYYVAQAEGRTPNNHFMHILKQNIAYFERVNGRIDISKLPELENKSV